MWLITNWPKTWYNFFSVVFPEIADRNRFWLYCLSWSPMFFIIFFSILQNVTILIPDNSISCIKANWVVFLLGKNPCMFWGSWRSEGSNQILRSDTRDHCLGATLMNFEKLFSLEPLEIYFWKLFSLTEKAKRVNINALIYIVAWQ